MLKKSKRYNWLYLSTTKVVQPKIQTKNLLRSNDFTYWSAHSFDLHVIDFCQQDNEYLFSSFSLYFYTAIRYILHDIKLKYLKRILPSIHF